MDLNISGFFGLLTFALSLYVVYRIVESSAPTGRKVLWIILVLLLPLIGAILWWFMGPRR